MLKPRTIVGAHRIESFEQHLGVAPNRAQWVFDLVRHRGRKIGDQGSTFGLFQPAAELFVTHGDILTPAPEFSRIWRTRGSPGDRRRRYADAVNPEEKLDALFSHLVEERWSELEAGLRDFGSSFGDLAELHWLWAHYHRGQDKLEDAVKALEQALELDENYGDAHYALAQLHRDMGHEQKAQAHELETLRCDLATERALDPKAVEQEQHFIERVAEKTLSDLPEHLRARLENVPILIDNRPSKDLVTSGFDPRAFGLFEGPEDKDARGLDAPALPARIVLFHASLVDTFPDKSELEEQVRITLLHEIGHYFGLDEDQVAELGLA